MAQITDEQIESIIELQLVDFNSMESVSVLLRGAIRKALALADAPEPPNRTGQCWQNKKSIHQIWHIVGFHAGQYQIVGKNDAHSNMSEDWLTTYFQRIPPPPADQDVKGWVCREPGNQEPWYETDGCLVGVDGPWYVPLDIAYHGKRRWIPTEPAPTPWPKLPCEAVYSENRSTWDVNDARPVMICTDCTQSEAKAIALALNMLPKFVAWLKKDQEEYPNTIVYHAGPRDALLAEIKAAAVKLPAGE